MAKCISDVKERINDRIVRYNAYIDAWKRVERVYTKQGKPFKVFSRNFNNCEIREKDYWNGEKELRVHGSFSQDGSIYPKSYFEDSINITQPLKTWDGEKPSDDRIIHEAYRDVFQLNVDEVMVEVDKKIEKKKFVIYVEYGGLGDNLFFSHINSFIKYIY